MAFLDTRSLLALKSVDKSAERIGSTPRLWAELLHQQYPDEFHHQDTNSESAFSALRRAWLHSQAIIRKKHQDLVSKNWLLFVYNMETVAGLTVSSTFLLALVGAWIQSLLTDDGRLGMSSLWPAWIAVTLACVQYSRQRVSIQYEYAFFSAEAVAAVTERELYMHPFFGFTLAMCWVAVLRSVEFITWGMWSVAIGPLWFLAASHLACNSPFWLGSARKQPACGLAFTTAAMATSLLTVAALVLRADGFVSKTAYAPIHVMLPWVGGLLFAAMIGLILVVMQVDFQVRLVWFLLALTTSIVLTALSAATNRVTLAWLLTFLFVCTECIVSSARTLKNADLACVIISALRPSPREFVPEHKRAFCYRCPHVEIPRRRRS